MAKAKLLFRHRQTFARAVKKSRGKVVVLVHPLFAKYDRIGTNTRNYGRYKAALERLLTKSKVPVIVLEERHKIGQTHAAFGEPHWPFYVETHLGSPTPYPANWEKLFKVFNAARVETILIGGVKAEKRTKGRGTVFSSIEQHEQRMARNPAITISQGCVGHAYRDLIEAGYKKVRLAPAVLYPHKPKYER